VKPLECEQRKTPPTLKGLNPFRVLLVVFFAIFSRGFTPGYEVEPLQGSFFYSSTLFEQALYCYNSDPEGLIIFSILP